MCPNDFLFASPFVSLPLYVSLSLSHRLWCTFVFSLSLSLFLSLFLSFLFTPWPFHYGGSSASLMSSYLEYLTKVVYKMCLTRNFQE